VAALDVLSHADAFGSLGLDRRGALWAIKGLSAAPRSRSSRPPTRGRERFCPKSPSPPYRSRR
jgi:hypothetical protein